jgi:glycosyltransferase involved in cell wall biosynthesis
LNKGYFINYICEVNFPNTSAYGLHVLKMCDALSSKKFKVNLFIPSLSIDQYSLKKNYNLKNQINFFPVYKNQIKMNLFTRIVFSFRILNSKYFDKSSLVITRSALFAILASFLNAKIILELHHDLSGITKFLYYFLKKRKMLENLRYIFIHRNLIKVFKPHIDKCICLDDAVDPDDFVFNNNLRKFNNTCVYIGSFHPGKGIEFIYEIAKKMKNINFHLYGDKQFLNLNHKITSNIKIFDYIEYKKIPKTLSRYDVALMPYSNKVYGRLKNINLAKSMSPLKMFDYLASSIIIVASDLKIYGHILKHKYNSILVSNSNIENWINCINKTFLKKNKFNQIKKNAYKTALKYTWVKRSDKIIRFANKQFF